MFKKAICGVMAAASASVCQAGGIDRFGQSVSVLFAEGNRLEFSFASVDPDVSGFFLGTVSSGDMSPGYTNSSMAYKRDIGDRVSFALIADQPIGADVEYPSGGSYPFNGAIAKVDSRALTAVGRYKLDGGFSIHGGVRVQSVDAEVFLPTGGGPYALTVSADTQLGYTAGVAYEVPEIALRVALTYHSEITHSFTDNSANPFDVVIPQSVNLEAQTGIAEDTLLFASARWAEWTKFDISPPEYPANPLASGKSDTVTYSLGVGRRFTENWSGAAVLGYEAPSDKTAGNLSPTDGFKSIGLAATYSTGKVSITGGARYIEIGDATTSSIGADFSGNSGMALGLKVALMLD